MQVALNVTLKSKKGKRKMAHLQQLFCLGVNFEASDDTVRVGWSCPPNSHVSCTNRNGTWRKNSVRSCKETQLSASNTDRMSPVSERIQKPISSWRKNVITNLNLRNGNRKSIFKNSTHPHLSSSQISRRRWWSRTGYLRQRETGTARKAAVA